MKKDNVDEFIAKSSGWVAALLNFLPGLGTGYIYQHRWRAYWMTFLVTILWITISSIIDLGDDPADPAPVMNDQFSLFGIFIISTITSIESFLSTKKSRDSINS